VEGRWTFLYPIVGQQALIEKRCDFHNIHTFPNEDDFLSPVSPMAGEVSRDGIVDPAILGLEIARDIRKPRFTAAKSEHALGLTPFTKLEGRVAGQKNPSERRTGPKAG
jgi:hypothetical protein